MKLDILPKNISKSWNDFLDEETLAKLKEIQESIGDNYNPEAKNVLRFLQVEVENIKVAILGQDPYPEKGRATGRAFEVGDLNDWSDKFKQVSLKNIIKLIYKSYNNIKNYSEIKTFKVIQKLINDGEFKILQPNELFSSWERQGVLMLNTYLTCEAGKPGSHRKIWKGFAGKIINFICDKNKDISWFLWGKDAISYEEFISSGKKYKSRHPMMCAEYYEDDFLKSECFLKTKDVINWLG